MTWQVVSRPEAENDVIEIAAWYDDHSQGLGDRFIEEFLTVLDELTVNPLLHCRRHPRKNIRWRYPKSFPYRVIYEVIHEQNIVVVWSLQPCCMLRGTIDDGSGESKKGSTLLRHCGEA